MEGVVNQFRHYVQDGELDRELLALTADPVAYNSIPSLLDGKYVYTTDHVEIRGVLHTLFSDQSALTYINDALKDSTAAQLLIQNEDSYTDFHEHQRSTVDRLGLGSGRRRFNHLQSTRTQYWCPARKRARAVFSTR